MDRIYEDRERERERENKKSAIPSADITMAQLVIKQRCLLTSLTPLSRDLICRYEARFS